MQHWKNEQLFASAILYVLMPLWLIKLRDKFSFYRDICPLSLAEKKIIYGNSKNIYSPIIENLIYLIIFKTITFSAMISKYGALQSVMLGEVLI